jgi:hypothetical protein
MNEPALVTGRADSATKESLSRPHDPQRQEGILHQVSVRFFQRMRRHRVYPLTVELHKLSSESSAGNWSTAPVLARPFIPGAQVTPPELELKSVQVGEKATFYVTPKAWGRLLGARLQLCQQGLVLQEIALPMKTAGALLTWILAALTVLVPLGALYFTKHVNLTSTGPNGVLHSPRSRGIGAALPANGQPVPPALAPQEPGKNALPPEAPQGGPPVLGPAVLLAPPAPVQGSGGQAKPDEKKPPRGDGDQPAEPPKPRAEQPPPAVEPAILERIHLPDFGARGGPGRLILEPSPKGPLERGLLDALPAVELGEVQLTASLAATLQQTYDLAHCLAMDHFSFYLGAVLLGLTLISWIVHRPARACRRGPPVLLAPGVGPTLLAEAAPVPWRTRPPTHSQNGA